jgi:hypothetical protein
MSGVGRDLNGRMLRHRTLKSRGPRRRGATVVTLLVAGLATSASLAAAGSPSSTGGSPSWDASGTNSSMMFETFSPDGHISLRHGEPDVKTPTLPTPTARRLRAAGGPSIVQIHNTGNTANRISLVFVGDGYTAAEQPKFAAAVESAWNALMSFEPYKTYQNFFDAYRVDIASPVSGISNDPTNGVTKATPLGMHFWCHNIDRLLCVDDTAASQYANLVPGRNRVIALANTTTYGGAGGSITTLAGQNYASDQVIVHEMAHTIAGLGDEYDVPYDTASGTAGDLANVASTTNTQLAATNTKWAKWLGAPSADGSVVGTYEGANYYKHGFYRPSADSNMRTLGKPFNPPSIEQLVKAFYVSRIGQGSINPIDSVSPDNLKPGGVSGFAGTPLVVNTVPLVGAGYHVYWGLDKMDGKGSTYFNGGTSVVPYWWGLKVGGWNLVTAYVQDTNPQVRDQDFMSANMYKSITWWVWGGW